MTEARKYIDGTRLVSGTSRGMTEDIESALGKIRAYAIDQRLTGSQLEALFEIGMAAEQILRQKGI